MCAQPSFDYRHPLLASSEAESTTRSAIERRAFARTPLRLRGRYMLEDGREFPCETLDISPIGIGIRGFAAGAIGDRVVAYFDELGRVEGHIVRRAPTWFAIDIMATSRKLERLAEVVDRLVGNETKAG
jgi:PilZ domain